MSPLILLLSLISVILADSCYWKDNCVFDLFATKTPYDSVRGDIRDAPRIPDCEPISVWSLNRHGNRNPGADVIAEMKRLSAIREDIISKYHSGNSYLCAQDIEDLSNWVWNATIESSSSFLTGCGYDELYSIGKRIRHTFPHLLETADESKFYFRSTNEQRTIVSAAAYVNGLTEGTNLKLSVDGPFEEDDVIRPYELCQKYQEEVKNNPIIAYQMNNYMESPDFIMVRENVQKRTGITQQLTSSEVYSIHELCRFYRSWSSNLRSPWCAVFSDEDLVVLEYLDDLRHYYRNGYGSWINVKLGEQAAKDLYSNFEEAIRGGGKHIITYFTHDTMMEMFFCALGLFHDGSPISYEYRNENRQWRTSYTAAFSSNFIAVLNRCNEFEEVTHKIQFFINEKPSSICAKNVCTLEEFREKFQGFSTANLEFCKQKTKFYRAIALP